MDGMNHLDDDEKAMLELADAHFKYPGAREARMREQFDLSPTLFWLQVDRLLNYPPTLAWNPMLTGRLRRLQEKRRRARSTDRLSEVG